VVDIIVLCYRPRWETFKTYKNLLENTDACNIITVRATQSVAANRNEGIKHVLSDPYVMCDDDIEVEEGWLRKLLPYMEDAKVGMVGPRVLRKGLKRLYRGPFDLPQNHKQGEVNHLVGCLMLIRNVGILADENYVGSQWEDTDLCYQYKARGYKCISTWDTTVKHKVSRLAKHASKNWEQNKQLFIRKWGQVP
jgi:GT2 family glycosyltransferase